MEEFGIIGKNELGSHSFTKGPLDEMTSDELDEEGPISYTLNRGEWEEKLREARELKQAEAMDQRINEIERIKKEIESLGIESDKLFDDMYKTHQQKDPQIQGINKRISELEKKLKDLENFN